jgi:hypothetical protein
MDRLLCFQYLYSYDANDLPKAINHKLFKNSLQMEVHFELLEEKNPVTVDMLVTSSCTVNGGLYSHNAEYPNIYPLPK